MAYLLTLGWPWFAGALALGALVGFLGFSRAKDVTFSGGWIVALGAVALAIGYSGSIAVALSGRDAVLLDITLLAGSAYALGLPIGGVIKSLAPESEKPRAKPLAPVIVAAAAPEPVVEQLPTPAVEPVVDTIQAATGASEPADPPSMETPLTALEPANADAPAAKKSRAKKASGVKPETLSAPRDGAPDDLSRIKGLGPKSREKLNALGVFHYDQIAAWNLDNAKWIGAAIGAPGRVERDKWIQQARALARAGVEPGMHMRLFQRAAIGALLFSPAPLLAQDMLQGVDLSQPAYSQSELTRAEVESAVKAGKLDFSGKSLNGLDLSGLDLTGANFRAARLNKARLAGAKLDKAILDQAWLMQADLTGASLKGAQAFAAQMQKLRGDGADFSGARVAGDLSGASLRNAIFNGANLSADMKNQSMGLMRAVLRSALLDNAKFVAANLMSADLRFAHAGGADFTDANLMNADAAGADFTGSLFKGAMTKDLDLDSAQIDAASEGALSQAQHLDRARRQ